MKIFEYKDYDAYKDAQQEANIAKIDRIWVSKSTIKEIVDKYGPFEHILCHGTRNGAEQTFFKQFSNAFVLGTEISDTAKDFSNTVQWDFTKENIDWIKAFDLVYSNSFDHSIDPNTTISTWLNQLKDNGKLCIEISFNEGDNRARKSDPLQLTQEEFKKIVSNAGGKIVKVLSTFGKWRNVRDLHEEDNPKRRLGIMVIPTQTFVIEKV